MNPSLKFIVAGGRVGENMHQSRFGAIITSHKSYSQLKQPRCMRKGIGTQFDNTLIINTRMGIFCIDTHRGVCGISLCLLVRNVRADFHNNYNVDFSKCMECMGSCVGGGATAAGDAQSEQTDSP